MSEKNMPIFKVLRLVRDARSTRNAERQMLDALAMRCQPDKKFLSWPSYRQLALDTQLDQVTLKRAAKRLEDKKLIKRVTRQNRSNCFYINVALLQVQAAAVKEAEQAAKEARDDEDSPFEQPVSAGDQDDADVVTQQDRDDWMTGGAR